MASLGLLFVVLSLLTGLPYTRSDDDSFVRAGYLPNYRFEINLNEVVLHLTDLYLFSISPKPILGGAMLESCCLVDDKYLIANKARAYRQQKNPSSDPLKLWVTIGGAERSRQCDRLYSDKDKQQQFVTLIVKKAKEHQLDGIDFDCVAGSREEFMSYLDFLKDVTDAIKQLSVNLLVSVTVRPGQLLPPHLYSALDQFHLTAYDMQGTFHAEMTKVKDAVEKLIESGCPSKKILLGIPAYGRSLQKFESHKTFSEILDEIPLDDQRNKWKGYRYDSPASLREKVEYAKSKGLGGVFLWELGQDKRNEVAPGGVLVEAMNGRIYETPKKEEL